MKRINLGLLDQPHQQEQVGESLQNVDRDRGRGGTWILALSLGRHLHLGEAEAALVPGHEGAEGLRDLDAFADLALDVPELANVALELVDLERRAAVESGLGADGGALGAVETQDVAGLALAALGLGDVVQAARDQGRGALAGLAVGGREEAGDALLAQVGTAARGQLAVVDPGRLADLGLFVQDVIVDARLAFLVGLVLLAKALDYQVDAVAPELGAQEEIVFTFTTSPVSCVCFAITDLEFMSDQFAGVILEIIR